MRDFFTEHSSFEQNQIAFNKIKNKKQIALLACDIARFVLPFWLNQSPDDKIVLEFIQTTENFLFDLTDLDQLTIAKNNVNASAVYNVAANITNSVYYVATNSSYNYSYYAAYYTAYYTTNSTYCSISNNLNYWNFIYNLYLQCFKPNHIIIPKLPIFLELAHEIKSTRNFTLYNVLKDAILDYSNIKINTKCLGLSNWLLFHLLLKD